MASDGAEDKQPAINKPRAKLIKGKQAGFPHCDNHLLDINEY